MTKSSSKHTTCASALHRGVGVGASNNRTMVGLRLLSSEHYAIKQWEVATARKLVPATSYLRAPPRPGGCIHVLGSAFQECDLGRDCRRGGVAYPCPRVNLISEGGNFIESVQPTGKRQRGVWSWPASAARGREHCQCGVNIQIYDLLIESSNGISSRLKIDRIGCFGAPHTALRPAGSINEPMGGGEGGPGHSRRALTGLACCADEPSF